MTQWSFRSPDACGADERFLELHDLRPLHRIRLMVDPRAMEAVIVVDAVKDVAFDQSTRIASKSIFGIGSAEALNLICE